MRNDRQFQQVLTAAHLAAAEHANQQRRLAEAMEERYGATHSDADEDSLIDTLNYGIGAPVSVAECDGLMAKAGHQKTNS